MEKSHIFAIIALFSLGIAFSQIGEGQDSIMPEQELDYAVYRDASLDECELPDSEVQSMKDFAISFFGLGNDAIINVTYNYCYSWEDYYSAYATISAKNSSEDVEFKSITISLSSGNEIDYNILMDGKANFFDYSLRNDYYEYFINSTDKNNYIIISYNYDENYSAEEFETDLIEYYDSLQKDEKYFQKDYYPYIVFNSKTSELLNIIPDFKSYISYYGDELSFTFAGENKGNYDLDYISKNYDCNIDSSDYFQFSDECYGSYSENEMLYFSAHDSGENHSAGLSVYGVNGYKAEFSAYYYGNISQNDAKEFIENIILQYFPKYSFTPDFSEKSQDSKIITGFSFSEPDFAGLNMSKERQYLNYQGNNIYASIIMPHISLYSSSARIYSVDSKIMPPFYSQNTIITNEAVYSSIMLKENDESKAKTGLNEMLSGIQNMDEWDLNMSLLRQYYYRGNGLAESSDSTAIGGISQPDRGTDSFDESSIDLSKFDDLQAKDESIIGSIINFFKGLFN